MYIFILLVACLLTCLACDLLWQKFLKGLWYPDKKAVQDSNTIEIVSEHDQEDDQSIHNEDTKEQPTPEDYLYKFFLKHKRRRLRVNKHFLHAPICRMEHLFARTYPNEYGHPPPLKIVSHLPNKLLK